MTAELLAPAGDIESGFAAFEYGAFLAVDLQSNQTLRCNASRFLGRSGQTFFALQFGIVLCKMSANGFRYAIRFRFCLSLCPPWLLL